jgi:hypothetical protein
VVPVSLHYRSGRGERKDAMSSRTENFIEMLIVVVAVVIFIPSVALAAPKPAINKLRVMLPPFEYDYPFQGKLTLIRGNLDVMNENCINNPLRKYPLSPLLPYPLGCSVSYRQAGSSPNSPAVFCNVWIAEPDLLRGWMAYEDVLRHELGHCNGWRGHDGGRTAPVQAGKPPANLESGTADLAGAAQAQPLPEKLAIGITATTLKICLSGFTELDKKTHTSDEIKNYCSCYAVTLVNKTTMAEYEIFKATNKWPDDMKERLESQAYCKKYLNLPDASEIRKKAW